MKAFIIDDEINAITTLNDLLDDYPSIEVIGKYTDPYVALNDIKNLNPDIIFLDVEMNPHNGLEMGHLYSEINSSLEIVFVTAHAEYAIDAFDINATDYLLKPVTKRRLQKTMTRLENVSIKPRAKANSIHIKSFRQFFLYDENDTPVRWRTAKAKELFIFLWINHKDFISKDTLVEALYPDKYYDRAITLFYTLVYQLRKLLYELGIEKPVLLQNGNYKLNYEFNSDLKRLHEIYLEKDFAEPVVNEIIGIYTGAFLEDESYPWIHSYQNQSNSMVQEILAEYLDIHKTNATILPNMKQVIDILFSIDPYSEETFAKAMSYYKTSNQLDMYQDLYLSFKDRLKKDLGINLPTISIYE